MQNQQSRIVDDGHRETQLDECRQVVQRLVLLRPLCGNTQALNPSPKDEAVACCTKPGLSATG